ncbi:hypothetical protein N9S84_00245 [Nitrosomonadales bacterium]|jgi:hypothetical protein|nr:hypothetical protein [Nitrosomonadales bacterium]
MKKKTIFLLLLFLYQNITFSETSTKTKQKLTAENFKLTKKCSSYKKIEGKNYCVKTSNITLNLCGRESDWPCMEENGCLTIDKFTLKN